MRKFTGIALIPVLMGVLLATALPATVAAGVTCTPTGFFRDGINMTAALIDPAGVVSGEVDATGCNIGVYYDTGSGAVSGADIHGANYFGVLVNGDTSTVSVDILASSIHDIGESPLNGTQHGVAVYYRAFLGGTTSGLISGNTISNYQKGGIVTNGAGTSVTITANTVTGQGSIGYIAQNGIQVGYGALASVKKNTVTGNSYTGTWGASSGGIIVVGGPFYGLCPDGYACPYTTGTQIVGNVVTGNDIGIYLSNWDVSASAIPTTPTNVKVTNNTISNNALNNTSGLGYPMGYQAGVSDVGNNDKIISNTISGQGYNQTFCGSSAFCAPIDVWAQGTKIHANTIE